MRHDMATSRAGPARVCGESSFADPAERPAATDLPGPAAPFPSNTRPDHLDAISTITATVAADGPNTLTFDLRSDGAGE